MTISVLPAEDADMQAIFTIGSRAFQNNEEFYTAHYPAHDTQEGRVKGGQRFLEAKQSDPNMVYIKAVDSETGQIAGFARWLIFTNRFLTTPSMETQHWETTDDAEYAHGLLVDFLKHREGHLAKTNGNMVSLDICAVDPDHQRKGVGGKLVSWGTAKADELGVDAVVESSRFGRGLYEKHGYVFVEDVTLPLPERFATRPPSTFAWLVRPRTNKA